MQATLKDSFNKRDIDAITPGKTTRDEILKRLGPPLVIVRRGGKVTVTELTKDGAANITVDSEEFFKHFGKPDEEESDDLIYYYRFMTKKSPMVAPPYPEVFEVVQWEVRVQRLFILIDITKNRVKDSKLIVETQRLRL